LNKTTIMKNGFLHLLTF